MSINSYAYCYNNPLIFFDPSGHIALDWSQWTGTQAEAVQLQALMDNKDDYDSGRIDADTASSNYTSIMDEYNRSTSNGNNNNSEARASQQSPKSNSNPDKLKQTTKPTTGGQEYSNNGSYLMQPNDVYDDGYSIDPFYGINESRRTEEISNLNTAGKVFSGLGLLASVATVATLAMAAVPFTVVVAIGAVGLASTLGGAFVTQLKYSGNYISESERNRAILMSAPEFALGLCGFGFAKPIAKTTLDIVRLSSGLLSRAFATGTALGGLIN